MACVCRDAHTWKELGRNIIQQRFRYIWHYRKDYFSDLLMQYVCKFIGHVPHLMNEHDPECNMVVCKRCGRHLPS